MIKALITFAAAAAVIVPAAQAGNPIVSPDDRAQARATSPALLGHSSTPDDRAINRATSPALLRSQGPDDRALPRATVDIRETPAPVQVIVRRPHGFDWADAATGAVAGIGLGAIFAALALLIGRSRRTGRPRTAAMVESA